MANFATGSKMLNPEKIMKEVGVSSGMRVADLGCGNGYFSLPAAQIVGGSGQVYAVDVLKSCLDTIGLEATHHQLLNVKPVWSNIETIGATDIQSESLDFALIVHTLYQAGNKASFLQETARLVKKKGKILITDWIKRKTPIGPPVQDRLSEEDLHILIKSIKNIEEIKTYIPGEYHYAILLEKK